MDQIMNKVGSYWLNKKANKEISSVSDDINSISSSIEGGAKWLVNKLKGGCFYKIVTLVQIRDDIKNGGKLLSNES